MYEPHRWNNTLYPLMKGAGYHVGFYGKYHHTTNWPIYPFSKGWLYYGDHFVTRDNVTRHVTEWNEMDAINSLSKAVKEVILSAIENDVIGDIYDPAHSKYWRMFNEAEAKQINLQLKKTLKKSVAGILENKLAHSTVEISHA